MKRRAPPQVVGALPGRSELFVNYLSLCGFRAVSVSYRTLPSAPVAMSHPNSERHAEEGPMISDTSDEGSEGALANAFLDDCRAKAINLSQKVAVLRDAGLAALDELKRRWEQQCDE